MSDYHIHTTYVCVSVSERENMNESEREREREGWTEKGVNVSVLYLF